MKKSQLRKIIKEEISKELKVNSITESQPPKFRAIHKPNNLVASIYFSWDQNDNNNPQFWGNVISIIENANCILINYVVTDSVCEFEFKVNPNNILPISQEILDQAKYDVEDGIETLSSQFTNADVYITD